MSRMAVCAVYDRAVEAYGQPIFCRHVGEAIRSFTDEINRKESQFFAHPSDYSLFQIGHYDDETGMLIPSDGNLLVSGTTVVRPSDVSM